MKTSFKSVQPGILSLVAAAGVLMVLSTTSKALDNTYYGTGALHTGTSTGLYDSAFGFDALYHNTSGGYNTAIGVNSLLNDTTGNYNLGIGVNALLNDTTGSSNTGIGVYTLYNCTTDSEDTAIGFEALYSDKVEASGQPSQNVAIGYQALYSSTGGYLDVAVGSQALFRTNGTQETAVGYQALVSNTNGNNNTAVGYEAMLNNTSASSNTAIGDSALGGVTSGGLNIGVGELAGSNQTNGSGNIYIGDSNRFAGEFDSVAGESNTIRLGATNTQTVTYIAGILGQTTNNNSTQMVIIDSTGRLGTISSSRRYKEDINDMGDASARLLRLRPVTFRYKKPYANGEKPIQYGLVAEEVADVFPELADYNAKGQPESVKYQILAPIMLNEFLKEHKRVEEQGRAIAAQDRTNASLAAKVASQEQEIATLTASLKEQSSLLQKVSAQLQLGKSAPQVVSNNN